MNPVLVHDKGTDASGNGHAGRAAGFDERHRVVPADILRDADALVKGKQIGAATKENVLAVVDDFTGAWMLVR